MSKKLKNSKGVIAETYQALQALSDLEIASSVYPTDKLSAWTLFKSIMQGVEIGVQNLNDLMNREIYDIKHNQIGNAAIKLSWFKDINYLLIKLTNIFQFVEHEELNTPTKNGIEISCIRELELLLKKHDKTIRKYFIDNKINIESILEEQNLNNELYKFLHDYRIVSYEITIWNNNLSYFCLPLDTTYESFIGLDLVTKAINDPKLKGDTFFMQFRCLHQIPEILTVVVNDYIEQSIKDMRENNFTVAHKNLRVANILLSLSIDALKPIIDNLSHNDYHQIRENLGLTSGSHSVNIHFHLFRDLYETISSEYMSAFFYSVDEYLKFIEKNYAVKLIEIELLTLRNTINQWRSFHLHLPRINLGENKTKSLIGANEAVESARKMQNTANNKDPLNPLATIYSKKYLSTNSMTAYLESERSFDKELGNTLGKISQKRFVDVQNRAGFFSNNSRFKKPIKRIV